MSSKRNKRRPRNNSKRLPAHQCDQHAHVMHFCPDPDCADPNCPESSNDLQMCGVGFSDLLAAAQAEMEPLDCDVCGEAGALRMRIGRHWLGEPRFIWWCTNGCSVSAIRQAMLKRGVEPGCLGDYGLSDINVYPLDADQPTALYRWFDEAHTLLYVGISDNLAVRVKGHIKGSSWMDFAVSSTIERFPTRSNALAAEEAAIKAEQPLFNYQHNKSPEAQKRLVDYLVKRGRVDLLVPAVSRG